MTIHLGIVGVAGRGGDLRRAIDRVAGLEIAAICDLDVDGMDRIGDELGIDARFTAYDEMLASGRVDAVLIGTPMGLHARQAIAALDAGIHVLSEVTACMDLGEARALVRAAEASAASYMLAENYCFRREVMIVEAMVRAGTFGTPYYAEAEYLHDCRGHFPATSWRRGIHADRDGCTYPTHSLGPVLRWFPGERVTAVMSVGCGRNHPAPEGGTYAQQAPNVMLCRMSGGGLAKIRVDVLSPRPHAMHNYQLQGTEACFDAMGGSYGAQPQIWSTRHSEGEAWAPLDSVAETYLPDCWRNAGDRVEGIGHGGGDLFQFEAFVAAIRDGAGGIDVHAALDMTLPGILSAESIAAGGAWIPVPDSREWATAVTNLG